MRINSENTLLSLNRETYLHVTTEKLDCSDLPEVINIGRYQSHITACTDRACGPLKYALISLYNEPNV